MTTSFARRSPCASFLIAVLLPIIPSILSPTILHADMLIRSYDAARHSRFYSGIDKAFLGNPYDWSGVGYSNTERWATLVSSQYFVSAYHFFPGPGAQVTFWEGNDLAGPSHTYTVESGARIGTTDLYIGWFDTPVDASLAVYSVLDLSSNGLYIGMELHNYGLVHRVGRNTADAVAPYSEAGSTGESLFFDFNTLTNIVGGDETYLWFGDSGAPTFAIYDGELALLGVHWSITDTTAPFEGESSIDTFIPSYIDDLDAVMTTGYGGAILTVPEPSVLLLLVSAASIVFIFRLHLRG